MATELPTSLIGQKRASGKLAGLVTTSRLLASNRFDHC